MVIKDREDIKNFVLSIEKNLPVNEWKYNGIHIWPLIRLELFFYIRKKLYHDRSKKAVKDNSKSLAHANRISAYVKILKQAREHVRFVKRLKQKKYLFVAHNDHRINYKGKLYNRFFDTLIEKRGIKENVAFIEIGKKSIQDLYNSEIVISQETILENYRAYLKVKRKIKKGKEAKFELNSYHKLLDFLSGIELTKEFSVKFNEPKIKKLILEHYSYKIDLYMEVLKKLQPEKLFSLCYYSDLALIAAANKLNIETIDMQHGAIASAHLAYGSWSQVPENGYDFLPKTYWCWDEQSCTAINEWASNKNKCNGIPGGNTWVDYWINNAETYKEKGFVLYTLQPDSLTLQQLFPKQLIEVIHSDKNNWFIRLHPRQIKQIGEIQQYLKDHNIFALVNLSDATNDPLPVLLKNCLIHVTNSSASTIEASLFGKQTILLHEIGKLYYSELIESKKAVYIKPDDEFVINFEEAVSKQTQSNTIKSLSNSYDFWFS